MRTGVPASLFLHALIELGQQLLEGIGLRCRAGVAEAAPGQIAFDALFVVVILGPDMAE